MADSPDKLNHPAPHERDTVEFPPAVPQPCNDCPWRRDATIGWLGPYTAEDWIEMLHSETPIACHQTIPKGGGWGEDTRQCSGAARMRANVCKTPRNPSIESEPIDEERVFSSNDEFLAHHNATEPPEPRRRHR